MKHCSFCGIGEDKAKVESYHGVYYCKKHYLQYMRHGKCFDRTIYDPNDYEVNGDTSKIFMYDRYGNRVGEALVDTEDLSKCLEFKWHLKKSRKTDYAITTINERKKVFMHRLVLGYREGCHDGGERLDSIARSATDFWPEEKGASRAEVALDGLDMLAVGHGGRC